MIHRHLQRGWCKYTLAIDAKGNPVHYASDTASAWCLAGALYKAGKKNLLNKFGDYLKEKFPEIKHNGYAAIIVANDKIVKTQKQAILLMKEFESCVGLS